MLCYLQSKMKKEREGKPDFFVCTWVGTIGDVNAEKVIKDPKTGRLKINIEAAKARTITLTKCIFPVSDEEATKWDKALEPLVELVVDKETGEITEKTRNTKVDDCLSLDLCYKQVPLKDISDTVKQIQFTSNSGRLIKQNFITVIGFADSDGNWAEQQSAEETALTNLNNNLSSGVYLDITDEEEEQAKE
ncbi:hypothetical protein [uncultured phage cr60_1]|uniref:Uncharacterized protein n=1 Tax=uncultured phage cr60_1 TaxID=2772082 RepID=A0A7M1RRI1_9CAUD|nr:hypothetical protein KNV49_gp79 [uncultured phage cr60_1]QOR56918.1 hypothetical protein [uncultured phage cr60_1]